MSIQKIAKIAVEHTTYTFDKEFSYLIPTELELLIKTGMRVKVPFGSGNRQRQGMIMEITDTDDINHNINQKLKSITKILDQEPLVNDEMIKLARFMKSRYFCTLFDAINTMLPTGIQYSEVDMYVLSKDISPKLKNTLSADENKIIDFLSKSTVPQRKDKILQEVGLAKQTNLLINLEKKKIILKDNKMIRKVKDANIRMIRLKNDDYVRIKLPKRQKEVYDLLKTVKCASQKEIMYFTGVTNSVINGLFKKGLVEIIEQEVYRTPYENNTEEQLHEEIKLTSQQKTAFNNILDDYNKNKPIVSLLHGVTGSGKTSVFMKVIDKTLQDNKGIILMVPEIALTTQLISIFKKRYQGKVAVFHSGLSMGERLDEYKRIKNGDAKIAIGTRSAIFAPIQNLGLIVMDEEQEYTYKSESTPRFHALDIAKFRVVYHNALLLLSSATPSLESYYNAKRNIYSLNTMNKRYGNAKLPNVCVVDMNEETLDGNTNIISQKLLEELKYTIDNNKQAILLLNRRGYNTFVRCKKCKEVVTCPNCSIAMTYHAANNRLMCHYCGYSMEYTEECPSCHEKALTYIGAGTQKIEDELQKLLPKARVLRVDADSTMSKFAHTEKFNSFRDKKYDIMIGTQMVAKGLDFDDVRLVGVLNADQSLYSDDFRSYEKSFDLITQVVGRAGRRDDTGVAIIQTYTPENMIINLAAKQDYETFYNSEIQIRKSMIYPPFCDICVIGFIGDKQLETFKVANKFFDALKSKAIKEYKNVPLVAFSVSSANLAKVNSKYRYKIILKTKNNKEFRNMISDLLIKFNEEKLNSKVSINADINPYNIM